MAKMIKKHLIKNTLLGMDESHKGVCKGFKNREYRKNHIIRAGNGKSPSLTGMCQNFQMSWNRMRQPVLLLLLSKARYQKMQKQHQELKEAKERKERNKKGKRANITAHVSFCAVEVCFLRCALFNTVLSSQNENTIF